MKKTEAHCPNACANAEIKGHFSYYIGLITKIAGSSPKPTLLFPLLAEPQLTNYIYHPSLLTGMTM